MTDDVQQRIAEYHAKMELFFGNFSFLLNSMSSTLQLAHAQYTELMAILETPGGGHLGELHDLHERITTLADLLREEEVP